MEETPSNFRGPERSCVMIREGLVFNHHLSVCKSTKWRCSLTFWCEVSRWSRIGALKYQIDLDSGKQRQKLNHLLSSPSQVQLHSLTPDSTPDPDGSGRMGNGSSQSPHLLGRLFSLSYTHFPCFLTHLSWLLGWAVPAVTPWNCVCVGWGSSSPSSERPPLQPQCQPLDT